MIGSGNVKPQQNETAKTLVQHLKFGIIQGAAAWSAYAVIEFLSSSVLFRLVRPYARFTTWHWELTGQLALSYLVAGVLAGAVAAVAAFLLSRWLSHGPIALVMEHAAAFTLALAVILHMASTPAPPVGWWKLLIVPIVLAALLLLSLRSQVWSDRLGLLTNPWLVAGLLLGLGLVSVLEDMGVAGQFGVPLQLWQYLLIAAQVLIAAAAIWFGRRWRQAANPSRVFAPNWAAIGLALALTVTGFVLGAEPSAPASPTAAVAGSSSHPNVVLVVMDTVRADHLSLFGYNRDTTPNLKKLAADATLYAQALSAADITLTSHASIFTGLYPSWHRAYCQPPEAAFGRKIRPDVATMAEVLSQNGYHTMGVAANLYLRYDFGLQRGFADFRIPRPVPILAAESWYMLRNGMRRAINLFADTAQYDRLYSRGDAVNGEFFNMLQEPKLAQAPFFAFFNYMDAHFPYIPPRPFDRLFPGKKSSVSEGDLEAIQDRVNGEGDRLPQLYTDYAVSQYDGGIAYIDSQIGQLVDWLKRQNLYDNTMIVVTADHGEAFGEKGLFLHGNSLYANLLHVPLLVKYPHSAHTGMVDAPVSLLDIFPTVMKVAGVTPPATLQGRDLQDPEALQPRDLFSESFPCPVLHQPACPGGCFMRTIVSWPNKFIWSSSGHLEAYELQRDPNENRNLFGALNKTAQALAADLRAWIKGMPEQKKQYNNLSPEEIQRFKSLGYIQ